MTFASSGAARVTDEHLSAQQFAFLPETKLLFTCGHWDHSCRITNAETGNLVQSVRQHRDVITCLALAKDFGQRWLVTGSRDCTLMVWDVSTDRELPLKAQPQYILYGHDDSVTCVAINPELDVVVSGSDDGSVIIHNLRDGSYVRSIVDSAMSYSSIAKSTMLSNAELGIAEESGLSGDLLDSNGRRLSLRPSSAAALAMSANAAALSASSSSSSGSGAQAAHRKITWVGLSKEAYVITYSGDDQLLSTYSMNGLLISSRTVPEALYSFMLSEDGKVLITGGSACLVVFRWVRTLELANDGPRQGFEAVLDGSMEDHHIPPMSYPIRSLHMTRLERHLIVGLESGEMRILAQDPNYLRQRLQNKLMEIGIL